jgi:hypothetical protein
MGLAIQRRDTHRHQLDIDTKLRQSGAKSNDALPVDTRDLDVGRRKVDEVPLADRDVRR